MTSLKELTDEELLDIFLLEIRPDKRDTDETPKPQFSMGNLVGKTISGYRDLENTLPYNPEVESPNPEYFLVIFLGDHEALLVENWSRPDENHQNIYYFNGREVLFSNELLNPDIAHLRGHF